MLSKLVLELFFMSLICTRSQVNVFLTLLSACPRETSQYSFRERRSSRNTSNCKKHLQTKLVLGPANLQPPTTHESCSDETRLREVFHRTFSQARASPERRDAGTAIMAAAPPLSALPVHPCSRTRLSGFAFAISNCCCLQRFERSHTCQESRYWHHVTRQSRQPNLEDEAAHSTLHTSTE